MTIGIFTDDFYPPKGGIGRHISNLYNYQKHKIIVFSCCKCNLKNHVRLRISFYRYLHNIAISMWLFLMLNHCIKKYKLTSVCIQAGKGGLFLLKKPSVPCTVISYHTYAQQIRAIKSQQSKKKFIPWEKKTYQLADKIICISKDTAQEVTNTYNIAKEKVIVIPCCVDTAKYYPIKNSAKIPNSILFVGRHDKRKGISFLIKSAALALKTNQNLKVFIGGTGPQLQNHINLANSLKIMNNVKFLGHIPEEKLNQWYNQVEIVIVPSVFEGFGLTVIEAMAAGTPVIGTNVSGIRSTIKHMITGLLVPFNDIISMTESINTLMENHNLRNSISKAALKEVISNYSAENISEKYIEEISSAKFRH